MLARLELTILTRDVQCSNNKIEADICYNFATSLTGLRDLRGLAMYVSFPISRSQFSSRSLHLSQKRDIHEMLCGSNELFFTRGLKFLLLTSD
jgi:hypothetical protein